MLSNFEFYFTAEFPVGKKLRAKLLISRGRLWHENVRIGEFGALSEEFRVAK